MREILEFLIFFMTGFPDHHACTLTNFGALKLTINKPSSGHKDRLMECLAFVGSEHVTSWRINTY